MRAAVVSDTHGHTEDIIRVLQRYEPDALFFLGDYCIDGERIAASLKPGMEWAQVAGNGDAFMDCSEPLERVVEWGGRRFFLVHGHKYWVKQSLEYLAEKGRQLQVDAVLFGHTHIPFMAKTAEDMWIINPGSAAFPRGTEDASFVLLEWEDEKPVIPLLVDVATGVVLYSGDDVC